MYRSTFVKTYTSTYVCAFYIIMCNRMRRAKSVKEILLDLQANNLSLKERHS